MNNKNNLARIDDALKRRKAEGEAGIGNVRTALKFIRENKKFSSMDIFQLAEDELAAINRRSKVKDPDVLVPVPVSDAYIAASKKKAIAKAKAKAKAAGERFDAAEHVYPASSESSKRANVKKLMEMVQELSEVRSGERTAPDTALVLAEKSSIDYDELGKLPFWDCFEALVDYHLPQCIHPAHSKYRRHSKYNKTAVSTALGIGQAHLRIGWTNKAVLRPVTLDRLYEGFKRYDSKVPASLFKSVYGDTYVPKKSRVILKVDEFPPKMKEAIESYIRFRNKPQATRSGPASSIELPNKWNPNGSTSLRLEDAIKRFIGYLVKHHKPALEFSSIEPSCLIDRDLLSAFLDWREENHPESSGTTSKDLVIRSDISNPNGWWMAMYGGHLSESEKEEFYRFFNREKTSFTKDAQVQKQEREDESGLPSGKTGAPWFFEQNTTAAEGWKILIKLIEQLKHNYIRSGGKHSGFYFLRVAVWISMAAEVPLRVKSSQRILLGNADDVAENRKHKMGTLYRENDQWHLFLPKVVLKNRDSNHTEDIKYSYSKSQTEWIDKLADQTNHGDLFFPGNMGNLVMKKTKLALKQLFPEKNYPGMNPHAMRHIVATYRLNVLNDDPKLVATLLMDRLKTVMDTYYSSDHESNLKAAQKHSDRLWAA